MPYETLVINRSRKKYFKLLIFASSFRNKIKHCRESEILLTLHLHRPHPYSRSPIMNLMYVSELMLTSFVYSNVSLKGIQIHIPGFPFCYYGWIFVFLRLTLILSIGSAHSCFIKDLTPAIIPLSLLCNQISPLYWIVPNGIQMCSNISIFKPGSSEARPSPQLLSVPSILLYSVSAVQTQVFAITLLSFSRRFPFSPLRPCSSHQWPRSVAGSSQQSAVLILLNSFE